MTWIKTGGGNCPDGVSCPARYERDRRSLVFVGPEVTDPGQRAMLNIGPGETAVEVPRDVEGARFLDAPALSAFLDGATCSIVRQQAREFYDVASDGGDFARYVHGDGAPDMARKAAWHDRLRATRDRGVQWRNVHVLRGEPGDYLRYAFEWGYALNAHLMSIRVLDLTGGTAPSRLILDDFYVVDGQDVALMHYDVAGRFRGASLLSGKALDYYRAAIGDAWNAAEDFGSWWARHPAYHRSSGHAAA